MSKLELAIEKLEELIFEMDSDGRNKYYVENAEDILGILNEAKYGEEEETTDDALAICFTEDEVPKYLGDKKVGTANVGRKAK